MPVPYRSDHQKDCHAEVAPTSYFREGSRQHSAFKHSAHEAAFRTWHL